MKPQVNVLVLGSGGREHAFCHKIAQSSILGRLYCAPGNPGIGNLAVNVDLNPLDGTAVAGFVKENDVHLVLIGPEAPLAEGVADVLRAKGIKVVGPGKEGAVLESSKEWSKRFMMRHAVPTAAYQGFESGQLAEAVAYVRNHSLPVVVKASGLAAGKGVVICATHDEAELAVRDMLSGEAFGEAGATIVVEEFLTGIEVSVFVLTDGKDYVLLPEAKDYKRIGEGDTGLNTGGMGAVSPVPFADKVFMDKVRSRIIEPTIQGLKSEGIDYRGFIFFGLISVNDEPFVIEYNARMGDPETEAVMLRIESDLLPVLMATAVGELCGEVIKPSEGTAVTVVLVSEGYPGEYRKGMPVDLRDSQDSAVVFHSGTKLSPDYQLLTNGGRVFAVTALGENMDDARNAAYAAAGKIEYQGKNFRNDIGLDLARL